jgi:hypothetical protein
MAEWWNSTNTEFRLYQPRPAFASPGVYARGKSPNA